MEQHHLRLANDEEVGRVGTLWGWSGATTGKGLAVSSFQARASGPTRAVSPGAGQVDQNIQGHGCNLRLQGLA